MFFVLIFGVYAQGDGIPPPPDAPAPPQLPPPKCSDFTEEGYFSDKARCEEECKEEDKECKLVDLPERFAGYYAIKCWACVTKKCTKPWEYEDLQKCEEDCFAIEGTPCVYENGCWVCREKREKQEKTSKQIRENLDKINLNEAPGVLRFILGKPKVNVEVNGAVYGFKIVGKRVKDFVEGGLDKPHYIIRLSEESVNEITESEDIMGKIEELYLNGEIVVEPQRVGAKIKFWFLEKFMGWFIEEEPEVELGVTDEVSEEEEETCEIECCCTVYLRKWGHCADYPDDAPRDWETEYTPPESSEGDGSVDGNFARTYVGQTSGIWDCVDMLKWKYTFTGKGDECKNKYDFCKEKLKDKCEKHKSDAESASSSAMEECVKQAKDKCKGRFSEYDDNKAVAGTC